MKTDVENNEWKAEAPYLASMQKVNPFSVPEQYFNALPDTVNRSVYAGQMKEVIGTPGFIVPDQYFTSLRERILAATSENVLPSFPKSAGYSTPDLYFQKLQSNILAKTIQEDLSVSSSSKIFRLWHSDMLKYASAACFILVTAFGLYLNHQNLNHQNFNKEDSAIDLANEQMLYDINEQEIIDHIEGDVEDKESVSNTDLETYILNNYSQNELSSAL